MSNQSSGWLSRFWRLFTPQQASVAADVDAKRLVVRFWEEVFNGENYDLIDELFAADFRLHDLTTNPAEPLETLDALRGLISTTREALPEARATVEEQFSAEGNRVVTRFKLSLPRQDETPAGEDEWLHFYGVGISRIAAGQIQESWLYWESLRASQEIEAPPNRWRWPPWWW